MSIWEPIIRPFKAAWNEFWAPFYDHDFDVLGNILAEQEEREEVLEPQPLCTCDRTDGPGRLLSCPVHESSSIGSSVQEAVEAGGAAAPSPLGSSGGAPHSIESDLNEYLTALTELQNTLLTETADRLRGLATAIDPRAQK